MARVLVVGSDMQREQALLQRLRGVADLPAGVRVSSCNALDACDLLVIRDTPALRNAARRMLSERPRLQCWVEDGQGRLHGDLSDGPAPLDDGAIARALSGMHGNAAAASKAPVVAQGIHAVTEELRCRLAARQGQLSLCLHGEVLLLLDMEHEQALPLREVGVLPRHLADNFESLQLQALQNAQWQQSSEGMPRHPLRPLLWQWAQSGGMRWPVLDQQLQEGAAVRLLRWPDFRVLGHDHDGFRLCSLLLKRACSSDECMRMLELPSALVHGFIHAAYLSGYARIEAAPPAIAHVPGASQGGLLARMWRSMRQRPGRAHA